MLEKEESDEEPLIQVLEIAGNAIVGGMEKYVYNLAQYLPVKGFGVTCITPYESAFTASLRHLGSQVYVTPMDDNPPWRSIQFVTELVRQTHIDLIHAHLPKAHVLAGIAGRLTGVPAVATIHGMEINTLDLGIARTTGTNLTVVCQAAYSQALALGVPAERLTLIPNGVDTKLFTPNRTGLNFRRTQHLPVSAPVVGFVGRLAWEKGPDMFLQLAEHVHEHMPQVHFVLVGDGPMEPELREIICNSGMGEYVHLAGLSNNPWEVYPAFDVLVQTSRVEGMPFALLEGMACGRPVAAMPAGGVPEIVEVGSTGLVSAVGDWAGLGNAVMKLLSNPEMMKGMGQAGRKRVEEAFDLQTSIQSMSTLFHRLVGREESHKEASLNSSWAIPQQTAVMVGENSSGRLIMVKGDKG